MKRAALLLALALAGCGEPAAPPASFAHRPVLAEGLARARAAVPADPEPGAALEEGHVSGLVEMLANSTGRMREVPLEEIGALGDAATAELAVLAHRADYEAPERLAAVELLAKLGTPRACEQLMQLVEKAPESWMRAQAAWRLGQTDADWLVPRMLLRMKYETDNDTVVWLADSLATFGNYDGLRVLWSFANEGATDELRATARARLDDIARRAGVASAEQHWELWNVADPEGVLQRTPSARLVLEAWKAIDQLSGEHFQLRGVDDARFQLSRMGAWVVPLLCEALHDDDVYVRVHGAQCLERMGPRAVASGPTLLDALSDPSLAIEAAAALGRVAYPDAEPKLRELLLAATTRHELRVACAAALGQLGLGASLAPLEQVANDAAEPRDLRQTAAVALVRAGAGDRAAAYLRDALADPLADQPGAEEALELWLRGRTDAAAKELLAAWSALAPPPGTFPTTAQADARRAQRHALLVEAWARL
ncbi:MAG: HEAT repeat domain-containing protein [Planctomycetes bacterium]|nr:HEAT repeat domain-containing protein [Planctomycetota bacterium]